MMYPDYETMIAHIKAKPEAVKLQQAIFDNIESYLALFAPAAKQFGRVPQIIINRTWQEPSYGRADNIVMFPKRLVDKQNGTLAHDNGPYPDHDDYGGAA